MADKKISQLPNLSSSNYTSSDVLLINNGLAPYTSQTTSKTSVLNFLKYYTGATNTLTGGTYNGVTLTLTFLGTQQNITMTGVTDTRLTGGTYVITATTGTLKLNTNRNNSFDVTGFTTGFTLTNQVQYNNNSNFSGATTFFVNPLSSQSWNTGTNLEITNTVFGEDAMVNSTGSGNTIYGYRSFKSGTTGSYNTFFGYLISQSSGTSSSNVGIGYNTMSGMTTGSLNISVSSLGLRNLTTGIANILIGNNSLSYVTSSNHHILIGNNSKNSSPNTDGSVTVGNYSVGSSENSKSVVIGDYAMAIAPSNDGSTVGFTVIGYSAYSQYNNANDQNRLPATAVGFLAGGNYTLSVNIACLGNRTSNVGEASYLGDYTGWGGSSSKVHAMGYKSGYRINTASTGVGIKSCGGEDGTYVQYWYETGLGAYTLTSTYANNTGTENTSIGYKSGESIGYVNSQEGRYSVTIGSQSALSVAARGVSVGYLSKGVFNGVKVGAYCGYNGVNSHSNVSYVGYKTGYNSTGNNNTGFGQESLYNLVSGTDTVGIGFKSLFLTTGSTNTGVGYYAGYNLSAGTNNTLIGYNSQPSNTASTTNNEITLGNSSIATLRCQVTSITSLSDVRDKKDVKPINVGVEFINKLNPVRFTWNMRDGSKIGNKSIGFIAQELQEVQNEFDVQDYLNLVSNSNPNKLEVSYGNMIPILIKSLQDLSNKNIEIKERIKKLSI